MKSFVKEKVIFILFSAILLLNIAFPVCATTDSLTAVVTDDTKIVEKQDESSKLELNSESAILIERETRKCVV